MWFKSIKCFKTNFLEANLDTAMAEANSAAHRFKSCKSFEASSVGWISPLADKMALVIENNKNNIDSENNEESDEFELEFVYKTADCWLMDLKIEEKIIPASVVREKTLARIEALQQERGRPLPAKEKTAIKEDIYSSMLPVAFTRSKHICGYIDCVTGSLILNTTQSSQIDLFLTFLRKTFSGLIISELENTHIQSTLTHWLQENNYPQDLVMEGACVIKDLKDNGIIRCQNEDLHSEEIINLINHNPDRVITQLSLSWLDQLRFTLTEDFMFKNIKFLEVLKDQAHDIQADSVQARFDADVSIMVLSFRAFLTGILEIIK